MAEKNMKQEESEKNQEAEVSVEKQLSSLDLMWKLGFDELDALSERFNHRDELFLEAVKNYVDKVKHNQENIKMVTEQFSKELKEWEKAAREELLVTTTSLQYFFPVKSYEEINQVVDDIQTKTTSMLLSPVNALTSGQTKALDKYLETVEQYISFRQKGREKYLNSVKKTTNVVYENQKLFIDQFAKQVKTAIFPFQKYMKNIAGATKS